MINALKFIQIIIFLLLIFPSFYILIREPFMKYKKYRKRRLTIFGFILLISMLIFMILSIIITYNDELYSTMKYAPFIQSWGVIKSSLLSYGQFLSIFIVGIGVYFCFIIITEKRVSKLDYNVINCTIPRKLSLRQKIEYPYMYYEMYVNIKCSKDGCYLLTDYGFKDLMEFEAKGN